MCVCVWLQNRDSGRVTVFDAVSSISEVMQLWADVPAHVKAVRDKVDLYNILGGEGGPLLGKTTHTHPSVVYLSLSLSLTHTHTHLCSLSLSLSLPRGILIISVRSAQRVDADHFIIISLFAAKYKRGDAINETEFGFLLDKMLPFKSLKNDVQLQELWAHQPRSLPSLPSSSSLPVPSLMR